MLKLHQKSKKTVHTGDSFFLTQKQNLVALSQFVRKLVVAKNKMQKIEIFEAGVKGRGLKSKKDMRIGELIFKEDAYAMVVMNAYSQVTCHHCLASCSLVSSCYVYVCGTRRLELKVLEGRSE